MHTVPFSLLLTDKHNSFSHTECTIDTWQRWCNLKHSRRTRVCAQNHPTQLEWKMFFILPPASRMKSPKYLKSVHLSKCHSLWIISCLQCSAVRQSKLLRKQRQLCLTVCNRRYRGNRCRQGSPNNCWGEGLLTLSSQILRINLCPEVWSAIII